jgi:hypothetical protein
MKSLVIEIESLKDGKWAVRVNGKIVAQTRTLFMAQEYVDVISAVAKVAGIELSNHGVKQ